MKKTVSKSKRFHSKQRQRCLTGIEGLEDRRVLAANVLASGVSSVSVGTTQDVTMTIATPDAAADADVVVSIAINSSTGSTLDPGAVVVLDANGAAVTPSFSNNDASGTSSQATVSIPAGVYTVQVSGENGTSGGYQVDVSLLGDVDATDTTTGTVSSAELNAAQLAFAQSFGTGNFVTDLFYRVTGLNGGEFETGFDANGDGAVDATDLSAIRQNADLGTVNIVLEVDGDGPEIGNIRFVTDTGVSATDGITSNPDLIADITDNSVISSVTASIDGGTAVNINDLVGDYNTTGSFVLDDADLTVINGGTAVADGTFTIQFIGTDELDNVSAPVSFSGTLVRTNLAPTTTGVADQSAVEDVAFSLNISSAFSDANTGDVLTYAATGLPAWLSLDGVTGQLTGTPENADVGSATVTVTATDSQGGNVSDAFEVSVSNTNDAPLLSTSIGTRNASEDNAFTLDFHDFFTDPDGDALTFTALQTTGFDGNGNFINGQQLPAWLTLSNGVLTGTPSDGDTGSFQVGVVAVDPTGATANSLFTVNVSGVNDVPTLVSPIPDQTGTEDTAFTLDTNSFFADEDTGDTLSITAIGLPASLSITGGVISGTPDDAAVGTSNITVTATDGAGASVSDSFVLTIDNVNDVPATQNESFVVDPAAANGTAVGTVTVSDDDVSDTHTFAITAGNAGGIFAINSAGVISVADSSQLAEGVNHTLTVEVTDSASATATSTVTVTVTSNFAPTALDDSGFSLFDDATLTITAVSLLSNDTDPDNDTLSIDSVDAASNLGASVTIVNSDVLYDPGSSNTLLALGDGESMTDTFTYTVSDGNGGTDTVTVSVVVNGVDIVEYRLEVLDSGGNVTTSVAAGATFTLVAFAEDLPPVTDGVFAAYLDVEYSGAAITVDGEIVHSTAFNQAISGTNTTAGLLDEVGGLSQSLSPTGGGEMEVFRQQFTAGSSAGAVNFSSNETESQSQRGTLLYNNNSVVNPLQIVFESTTLTITSSAAAAGIVFNPHDVNGDGFVSPLDALQVINVLNGSSAAVAGMDVNGDGNVTPLDALLVINDLFVGSAGGSDVLVGNNADVSETDLAGALEFLFEELAGDLAADPIATAATLTNLDSPLVDSIFDVVNADESEQEAMWDSLADDLAALLT